MASKKAAAKKKLTPAKEIEARYHPASDIAARLQKLASQMTPQMGNCLYIRNLNAALKKVEREMVQLLKEAE